MRPGLVVVGGILLLLGVAAILVLLDSPSGPGTVSTTKFQAVPITVPAGAPREIVFPAGTASLAGDFLLSWNSTSPVDVLVFPNGSSTAVAAWSNVTTGQFTATGTIPVPYHIDVTVHAASGSGGPTNASFTVGGVLQHSSAGSAGSSPGGWTGWLLYAAAGALGVIGGIAVFLGLFLRAGVFGPPRPPAPPSAAVTGPRTGR